MRGVERGRAGGGVLPQGLLESGVPLLCQGNEALQLPIGFVLPDVTLCGSLRSLDAGELCELCRPGAEWAERPRERQPLERTNRRVPRELYGAGTRPRAISS